MQNNKRSRVQRLIDAALMAAASVQRNPVRTRSILHQAHRATRSLRFQGGRAENTLNLSREV